MTEHDDHFFEPTCDECLDAHEWTKCICCPTTLYLPKGATFGTNGAIAFGVHDANEIPVLHRPRSEQFIRYFDAGLIPNPLGEKVKA